MAYSQEINVSDSKINHNASYVFNKYMRKVRLTCLSGKYGISVDNPMSKAFEFKVSYLHTQNESIMDMIEAVKSSLENQVYNGGKYSFEFVRTEKHDKIENYRFLYFYVLNPNDLSRLIWENPKFKTLVKETWYTFKKANKKGKLLRNPINDQLVTSSGKIIGFDYLVEIQDSIEFKREAEQLIRSVVEEYVIIVGSKYSKNSKVVTRLSEEFYNDSKFTLSVFIV